MWVLNQDNPQPVLQMLRFDKGNQGNRTLGHLFIKLDQIHQQMDCPLNIVTERVDYE